MKLWKNTIKIKPVSLKAETVIICKFLAPHHKSWPPQLLAVIAIISVILLTNNHGGRETPQFHYRVAATLRKFVTLVQINYVPNHVYANNIS